LNSAPSVDLVVVDCSPRASSLANSRSRNPNPCSHIELRSRSRPVARPGNFPFLPRPNLRARRRHCLARHVMLSTTARSFRCRECIGKARSSATSRHTFPSSDGISVANGRGVSYPAARSCHNIERRVRSICSIQARAAGLHRSALPRPS
jgi:hypothetical protein